MKKFKFRLEKVLHYGNIEKEEKLRELKLANNSLRESEDRLAALKELELQNSIKEAQVQDVENYVMAGLYAQRLKEEIVQVGLEIIKKQEIVDQALAAYIEASKETKTLETLKDKKKQAYDQYVLAEEEKFLDELVTQRNKNNRF